MSALYLSIIGYFGSTFGTLPKIASIWIGFISGSIPALLNFLAQIILLVFIIYTAIAKPYFRNEKALFLLSLIVLGANAFLHILVLNQTPREILIFSVGSILLFYSSLGYYGYKVFKFDS